MKLLRRRRAVAFLLAASFLSLGVLETRAATTYTLRSANSDCTGGADFTRELRSGTETAGSITFSVANGATEDSLGFTPAGNPSTDGTTGNYTVEVSVTTGSSAIQGSVAVARVNSSCVQQQISAFTAEQTMTAGVKTFTLNSINLGTWGAGDRLKVVYRFRSTNTHGGAASLTIETGTADTEATAPWSLSVSGDGAATEAADTASSSATVEWIATGAATEAADEGAASGTVEWLATGTATETADTAASAAISEWILTGAPTETADTAAGSGNVQSDEITGDGAVTETADAVSDGATVEWAATGAATETADAGASSGTVEWLATAATTEAADAAAGAAISEWILTGAAAETADAVSDGGTVAWTATGAATEISDAGAAAGATEWIVTGAATETADMAAGNVTSQWILTAALTELADAAAGSGIVGEIALPPDRRTWHPSQRMHEFLLPPDTRSYEVPKP